MTVRVAKVDGILPTTADNLAELATAGAALDERECLTEEALIEHCADADGILVLREPITARVIAALRSCKVISRFGIGVDMIDVAAARAAGIVVTNVPDSNVEEVAAHALAMALALSRRLPAFDQRLRSGDWTSIPVARGMMRPSVQVFGLLGLGRIGMLVAERARAFGFKIIAHDPFSAPVDGVERVDFATLLAQADILSLHLPLTAATAGIIDGAAIGALKPGAIVINVSRGGLVDEEALSRALREGQLAGAGIDTFAQEPITSGNPLFDAPNVLLSAHIAHFSEQSFAELRDKAFADMARVLSGEQPRYPVEG